MNSEQISTVLLLIIISIAIYYLACPNAKFNYESLDNTSQPSQSQQPLQPSPSQSQSQQPLQPSQSQSQSQQPLQPSQSQQPLQPPPNVYDPSRQQQITNLNHNDINNFLSNNNINNFLPNSNINDQADIQSNFTLLNNNNKFIQNEDSVGTGADLTKAFTLPVQNPVETADKLNLNKNNTEKYNVKDFLPNEIKDNWFDNFQAQYNINDSNLINPDKYIIGINTVGQSLKNASYDIRGTIPNPKYSVSPWNNSTYEADYNIKPLC
jgi:hypothetical protein